MTFSASLVVLTSSRHLGSTCFHYCLLAYTNAIIILQDLSSYSIFFANIFYVCAGIFSAHQIKTRDCNRNLGR